MVTVGKRVDAIQKQWQQLFVEAAWHQPSVILFDDLDQIVSAPSALQEMGGEALYKRRLAQGDSSVSQPVELSITHIICLLVSLFILFVHSFLCLFIQSLVFLLFHSFTGSLLIIITSAVCISINFYLQ